jgi:hypothetical protein
MEFGEGASDELMGYGDQRHAPRIGVTIDRKRIIAWRKRLKA